MNNSALKTILLSAAICSAMTGMARADCESDMIQLEEAYKTANLKPDAKAALDVATTKSVAAMKKDDDASCHQAIADALTKAGIPMK